MASGRDGDGARPARTVPVVCGVIERGAAFLAARRAPGQSNPGLWEFPGGKVHEGETTEAALARELQEELGVRIRITAPLGSHPYTYPWITIELIPFICILDEGEPAPREHAEIKWIEANEAQTLFWAPADVPVLLDYLEFRRALNG